MPDRSIICAVYASPPIQYLVGVVAYLFDGHVMGADYLVRLHAGQLHVKVQAAQDVQRSHELDFFKSGGGENGNFFHG